MDTNPAEPTVADDDRHDVDPDVDVDALVTASSWFAVRSRRVGDEYVTTAADEVVMVALDADGDVLLAEEPSPAFGGRTLVLPGGQTEHGVDDVEQANRELEEEVGLRADRVVALGELRPWSKYLAVRTYVFLGRDLRPSVRQGDEVHTIGVVRVPLDGFEAMIADGRLLDARVVAALYLARSFVAAERA